MLFRHRRNYQMTLWGGRLFSHKMRLLLITLHHSTVTQNNCTRQQSIHTGNSLGYEQWSLFLQWHSLRWTENDQLPGIIAQSLSRFQNISGGRDFQIINLYPGTSNHRQKKRGKNHFRTLKHDILWSLSFPSKYQTLTNKSEGKWWIMEEEVVLFCFTRIPWQDILILKCFNLEVLDSHWSDQIPHAN